MNNQTKKLHLGSLNGKDENYFNDNFILVKKDNLINNKKHYSPIIQISNVEDLSFINL